MWEQSSGKWMTGSLQECNVCKCERRGGKLVALVNSHPHLLVCFTPLSSIFK